LQQYPVRYRQACTTGADSRNSVPVVILPLDHYGALGVVRSLGRLGVDVYGVHANDQAPAFKSRYCRGAFLWDLEKAPTNESVSFLCDHVSRTIGSRAILLPSNDETALFIAENEPSLRSGFSFPNTPADLVHVLYDKRKMYLLARQLGIPTPECFFPTSAAEVTRFSGHARFPLVLKAIDGAAVSKRAGKKTVIARSPQDLLQQYQLMEDPQRPGLIIQDYIPGEAWTFNGYFNQNSECLFGSTGKKLRQAPAYSGMISLGVCEKNEVLESMTKYFAKTIGYKGILDIDYCHDPRDGTYKVLDVNPRLGASFRLFVGVDDMDVVRALYRQDRKSVV